MWNATMVHYTGYTRSDINPCLLRIAQWARDIQLPNAKLNAVYRKYSKKFFGVASSCQSALDGDKPRRGGRRFKRMSKSLIASPPGILAQTTRWLRRPKPGMLVPS